MATSVDERQCRNGSVTVAPPRLILVPVTLAEAKAFVERHHRHHGPTVGHILSVGVATDAGDMVGVATVGRPVSRMLDTGWVAEVTRCCTDGTPHAASKLYAAAWRACRALGYQRLITYTLVTEPGTSLRAAGWRCVGEAGGGTWNRKGRPRVDTHPLQVKLRWEVEA